MPSWWKEPATGLRIGGHRGASRRAPENTISSFLLAADAGADYLEFDVHRARDGVLVVIHDDELERTTDGRGLVVDHTSTELQGLDAGSWRGSTWNGERIPTLTDLLAWLVGRRSLGGTQIAALAEAKGPRTGAPLARVLAKSPIADHLAICSFSSDELLAARQAAPSISTMLIVDRDRPEIDHSAAALECGATIVNIPTNWLSAGDLDRLHRSGLRVYGGTGDDKATIERAVTLGLDGIDSNVPDLAVAWRATALSPNRVQGSVASA